MQMQAHTDVIPSNSAGSTQMESCNAVHMARTCGWHSNCGGLGRRTTLEKLPSSTIFGRIDLQRHIKIQQLNGMQRAPYCNIAGKSKRDAPVLHVNTTSLCQTMRRSQNSQWHCSKQHIPAVSLDTPRVQHSNGPRLIVATDRKNCRYNSAPQLSGEAGLGCPLLRRPCNDGLEELHGGRVLLLPARIEDQIPHRGPNAGSNVDSANQGAYIAPLR